MKILIIFIFSFYILNFVNAFENKIIIKIENEIITSVDLENEKKYLTALNPNIKNLENDKLNIISKNSLVRENQRKWNFEIRRDNKNRWKIFKWVN